MSLAVLSFLAAVLAHAGCDEADPETATSAQELVNGAPLIISTTINAPIASGRYLLVQGKAYTATVTVDAGTITYLTRVESNGIPASFALTPAYRDDTVIAYTGHYVYTYTITPSTSGSFQVAFEIRDRGSNNVYDRDGGVAVTVSTTPAAPRVASTTISAPIWNNQYQLFVGQSYSVTVVVASGNIGYNARVAGNLLDASLHVSPANSTWFNIGALGADQTYTFTITPSTINTNPGYPVTFQLQDEGTLNYFNGGATLQTVVNGTAAPRITSTTITGVTPTNGQYVLTIGLRYDVVVHVVQGTSPYTVAVEQNDQLLPPGSANLHNLSTATGVTLTQPYDFHFTITPGLSAGDPNSYPVSFMLHDCPTWPCAGSKFGWDPGITVVAAAPNDPVLGGLYGYVTRARDGLVMNGAKLQLENGATTFSASNGFYSFSTVPSGTHTLTVTMPGGGYSTTVVTHLTVPAPGMRVDADLADYFTRLVNVGMSYTRYIDYLSGRTIFHVVRISTASDYVKVLPSADSGYQTPANIASGQNPIPEVTINGGYFDSGGVDANGNPCNYQVGSFVPVGYLYAGEYLSDCQLATGPTDQETAPVLGISGSSLNHFMIVDKTGWFGTSSWAPYLPGMPLWDDNRDGVSDVASAIQSAPRLVSNSQGITGWTGDYNYYWPRTALGLASNGDLFMVVADGENLPSRQGANMSEVVSFFVDILHVTDAMNVDGGGSTTMALYRDDGTVQNVNTPTSENLNSSTDSKVLDFVMAW